jgi:5-formyltetrahydrofolate cyclo-ligase
MKTPVKEEKRLLRDKYRRNREEIPPENKEASDNAIYECFINTMAYKNSGQILLYASMEKEIDTSKIFGKALEDRKKCLFPKCQKSFEMSFYYVGGTDELKRGSYNISEPVGETIYTPEHFDICVIPAFTYDVYGYRLGYGKGYYDRFLANFSGIKIGLCYSDCIYKEKSLPRGRYDIKVDILITDKGVFPLQSVEKYSGKKNFIYQGNNK